MKTRQPWRCHAFPSASAVFLAIFFLIATPHLGRAHGELLLRIADLTKKIKEATNNPAQLYLERGELHREDKDWRAAASDYDRAAQLNAKLSTVDFCRAKMLDDSGRFVETRDKFDQLIGRSPREGEAYIGRARVLVKLNQREKAAADFHRGLEFSTNSRPEYFLESADNLMAQSRPKEALRDLDEGVKKLGPLIPLQESALRIELAMTNHDAALARLQIIIKQAPRKEHWFAQRGDILRAGDRFSEAREAYVDSLNAIKELPLRIQQGPALASLAARMKTEIKILESQNDLKKVKKL